MNYYDPAKFAEWLNDMFRNSRFKSYSELAERAGITRSTVSSLVSAKPQTATGKASQPRAETVIALANALGADVDGALLAAGHAPRSLVHKPRNAPEFLEALTAMGLPNIIPYTGIYNLTPDEYESLLHDVSMAVEMSLRRAGKVVKQKIDYMEINVGGEDVLDRAG